MGNLVTRNFEKWGNSFLANAAKDKLLSPATAKRYDFIGTELVSTRATYNDYLVGVSEFKQSLKDGLLGRDVAGVVCITATAILSFYFGRSLGRRQAAPYELPPHKYPTEEELHKKHGH